MRVLHVISSMDPVTGGPCQGIRNLASVESSIQMEVVCLDSPTSDFLSKDSFKIHALGSANNLWHHNASLLPWLKQNLNRFDVVIIEGLWLYHSYATWKAWRDTQETLPKLFVMPHGMLDPWFQKSNNRRLKAIRNYFYWMLLESKVINDSDALLFTSDVELMSARSTFKNYYPKKEINVGYGIAHPPSFQAEMADAFLRKCSCVKDRQYILFIGRIDRKKGVNLLLSALSKLYTKVLGRKYIPALVIAGPGIDTPYGQTVVDTIAKSKVLQENVFLTGMLTGNEKWGAIYGCDAFVLPSHQENFGIAVVESLACSKPVLITNKVNIWKEICETGAGLIEEDSFAGVYELIDGWTNMSTEAKVTMRQKAYATYNRFFSAEAFAERMRMIFEV